MEDAKIERKKKRFAARLKSSKGLTCTEQPCPNLVLCNAGQGTGLEKETIIKLISSISPNIHLVKFIAEKGETHSFLVFKDTENASFFYRTFNGKARIGEKESPIYMSFIENVPTNEVTCPHENPKGLTILDNFLTKREEQEFIELFDWTAEDGNLKNRQVMHYGYEFRYGSNDVDLSSPLSQKIPSNCDVFWERLKEHGFDLGVPDQLTVNKYSPGQGIPSHVDRHSPFGSTILSVSLGSSVVMDWRHHSGNYVPVVIPARSMLVIQDEARYDWQHGIQPRTWDPIIEHRTIDNKLVKVITNDVKQRQIRISLTFRWTRKGPCDCGYKMLCDSVDSKSSDDIEDAVASHLEELHVHKVYEEIAGHFSTTRHKPWPKVVEFMQDVPTGAVVVDLGCGNGKNILHRNDILQIAAERSWGLLEECARNTRRVQTAQRVRLDALHAALRDSCADYIICIAVVHHMSSRARRIQAISTISRLLRKGGRALITVWAKDQHNSNYLCRNKHNSTEQARVTIGDINLPVHENRTQFQHNDLLVPWKLRTVDENKLSSQPKTTLLRYYHVFQKGELEELCSEVEDIAIENSFYEEGNWCVICRKI